MGKNLEDLTFKRSLKLLSLHPKKFDINHKLQAHYQTDEGSNKFYISLYSLILYTSFMGVNRSS